MSRALVISGGGALGAWGAGFITARQQLKPVLYDNVIGVSTGALMAPLVALQEWDKLKAGYTGIDNSDVFSKSPFTRRGRIHYLKALISLLMRKPALGETDALLQTIRSFYTYSMHTTVRELPVDVTVVAYNVQLDSTQYFRAKDYTWDVYTKLMQASAAVPILMPPVEVLGSQYIDGGIAENVPIQHALKRGATEVDVIVHGAHNGAVQPKLKGLLSVIKKCVAVLMREVREDDIQPYLETPNAELYIHRQSQLSALRADPLLFEQSVMLKLYEDGYASGTATAW